MTEAQLQLVYVNKPTNQQLQGAHWLLCLRGLVLGGAQVMSSGVCLSLFPASLSAKLLALLLSVGLFLFCPCSPFSPSQETWLVLDLQPSEPSAVTSCGLISPSVVLVTAALVTDAAGFSTFPRVPRSCCVRRKECLLSEICTYFQAFWNLPESPGPADPNLEHQVLVHELSCLDSFSRPRKECL